MAGMSENRNRLGVKAAIPPDVRARLDALAGGDAHATARFIEYIAPIVWAACSVLASGDAEARPAFREVIQSLSAENFALVRTYDGRCRFEDFLALKVRDVLGERVLRLLRADKERGWRAVEGFFRTDLLRLIQRRLPSGHYADARQDAYQAISLALVEGDCRRLNSYDGRGSFTAFVLRMADRILIDHLRSANTRRRQTEAFVQAVALDGEAIEASPEVRRLLADDEADLKKAADVLACAIPSLSTPEQLYVAILLAHAETPPAREIARLMQRPTEEIYKMKQRILKRLRDLIAEDAAVKTWRASV